MGIADPESSEHGASDLSLEGQEDIHVNEPTQAGLVASFLKLLEADPELLDELSRRLDEPVVD